MNLYIKILKRMVENLLRYQVFVEFYKIYSKFIKLVNGKIFPIYLYLFFHKVKIKRGNLHLVTKRFIFDMLVCLEFV